MSTIAVIGMPIPGLRARSRTAVGILNYPHDLSGLSLGEGIMFGRIAGETAARSTV